MFIFLKSILLLITFILIINKIAIGAAADSVSVKTVSDIIIDADEDGELDLLGQGSLLVDGLLLAHLFFMTAI